jgi:hypothetical protein
MGGLQSEIEWNLDFCQLFERAENTTNNIVKCKLLRYRFLAYLVDVDIVI